MRKHYPLDPSTGAENAALLPWSDGVPQTGTPGSYPGQALVTDQEAELLNAIAGTGGTSNGGDLTQLLQAISSGLFLGTFAGTANALVAALPGSVAIPALVVGMTFTGFVGLNTNTDVATLHITGFQADAGTQPIVRKDGTSTLKPGDLPKNNLMSFRWDGTSFRTVERTPSDLSTFLTTTAVQSGIVRPRLTANLTLYVNLGTGSDANDGKSAGSPFKTLQAAANASITYDCAGYNISVQVAPPPAGQSYAGVTCSNLTGSPSPLTWNGSPTSPGSVPVAATATGGGLGSSAFNATTGCALIVNGFQVSSLYLHGLYAQGAGALIQYQNIIFGACPNGSHVIGVLGGECLIGFGTLIYQIVGSARYHFYADNAGTIFNNNTSSGTTTITLTGTPAFSGSFAQSNTSGSLTLPSLGFSGAATGARFGVSLNGSISTNGGGANYFPGSTAGTGAVTSGAGQNYA